MYYRFAEGCAYFMKVFLGADCDASSIHSFEISVTARNDVATAAVQAATTTVAGWDPSSGGGGLIYNNSG
jgi:hypothetical protein